LELLQDLLDEEIAKETILFKQNKFSEDEVKILQFVINRLILEGEKLTNTEFILERLFSEIEFKNQIKYVDIFQGLMEKDCLEISQGRNLMRIDDLLFQSQDNSSYDMLKTDIVQSMVSLKDSCIFFLENGYEEAEKIVVDIKNQEITPYENVYQYILDKTRKIEPFIFRSGLKIAKSVFNEIDNLIEKRLKISKNINTYLDSVIKKKKLSFLEEIVFLFLVYEEYSAKPFGARQDFRKQKNILAFLNFNDEDRFRNISLFREDSNLLKSGLIGIEEVVKMQGDEVASVVSEELFIPEKILLKIEGKKGKQKSLKLKELVKKQELFEYIRPKKDLSSVVLPEKTKEVLDTIVQQLDLKVINRLVKWGIRKKDGGINARIIFHGSAGTGKTMSAIALAKTLKKDILFFDCSKILSMYVGESEKNVRNIFDTYKDLSSKSGAEPVLFLNEADQFLTARSNDVGNSVSQMHNQMQNIFLEQIENFNGVLIATTNMIDNLDKAFSRRFNYKVEFKPPTKSERIEIWKKHLPKTAPFEKGFSVEKLSEFKLTGGQIDLIVKNTAFQVATKEKAIFSIDDFLKEINREKNSNFENDKVMGFLAL
jgi:SpoVK/Ycf46/Vps4 family AAA+-type ATPase